MKYIKTITENERKTEPLIFEDFTIHHLSEYSIEATPNGVHLIGHGKL